MHRTGGLWAEPVRPPTEIAGFSYRLGGVRILTSGSVTQLTERIEMAVSVTVEFTPRLKPWAFSLNLCNTADWPSLWA